MSARERILAIRLLEKIRKSPEYAKNLGIAVVLAKVDAGNRTNVL